MNFTQKIITAAIATSALTIGLTACDDSTSTIGSSLITDRSEIIIDSAFTLQGQSKANPDIQSRTTTQLLGVIDAKEFGSFSSEVVTQFMPSLQLDTTGVKVADIDSVKMLMFYTAGSLTGDSLVPMGLKIYPLTRQLPSPIYSDFDPQGYYDPNNTWTPTSVIYTGNALSNDSLNALAYRTVSIDLPLEFGRKFYNEYLTNPSTFGSPQAFAQFFPGVYIQNSFGSGRVINFEETRINLYYHRHTTYLDSLEQVRDTTLAGAATYMAVSPEVVCNNIIRTKISQQLVDMVAAGQTILAAPAGYEATMTFPTPAILSSYRANGGDLSVINSLSLSIPVETITNTYGIQPPKNLLFLLSKDKAEFFANNKITDNVTSFLATYNALTGTYEFTDLRPYIMEMLRRDSLSADDYTFTLTPVSVTTEESASSYYYSGTTYVTAITPYVDGPAMCKILLDKAKIKFTYSKQIVNN